MKRLLMYAVLIVLAACTKTELSQTTKTPTIPTIGQLPPKCEMLVETPDHAARSSHRMWYDYISSIFSNPKSVQVANTMCFYINFDGGNLIHTVWNRNGDTIKLAPANMSDADKAAVIANVEDDYAPFPVLVTTDSNVYNSFNSKMRQTCYVTESSDWYSAYVGGVSYVTSAYWGDNTPCFAFSNRLYDYSKYVMEAVSHEFGHTIGLWHQCIYDASGSRISDYNPGYTNGYLGFAPIMGVGYYKYYTNWFKGTTVTPSTVVDEYSTIAAALGTRNDDSDSLSLFLNRIKLPYTGTLNRKDDKDYLQVRFDKTTTISFTSANANLQEHVYDVRFHDKGIYTDSTTVEDKITLTKGIYFIEVQAGAAIDSNQYQTGLYHVSETSLSQ